MLLPEYFAAKDSVDGLDYVPRCGIEAAMGVRLGHVVHSTVALPFHIPIQHEDP